MDTKRIKLSVCAVVLCAGAAMASNGSDSEPDFGLTFVTIGDPSNRPTLDHELGLATSNRHWGSVDYEYRMATTEVTVGQYFEFVQAYVSIYEARTGHSFGFSEFTGGDIRTAFGQATIEKGVSLNKPVDMDWEYAARYVNWLHNDKSLDEAAFESGVYETSTFTQNEDGTWNHQSDHNPDARYWLPSVHEWVKAGYWDPDLNDGEGGYHLFPNSSSEQSVPGIGRNAGVTSDFPWDIGLFPDVMSPWGLLDMQGGVSEWSETIFDDDPSNRILMGSNWGEAAHGELIHGDMLGRASLGASGGIRLASAIPPAADLDRNWKVDWFDVSYFLEHYLAGDLEVDLNNDQALDGNDVFEFLSLLEQSNDN